MKNSNVEIVGNDGKKAVLTLEKALAVVAKAMLAQGHSMLTVKVDDLHDARLSLEWCPKEVGTPKDPRGFGGDHECG